MKNVCMIVALLVVTCPAWAQQQQDPAERERRTEEFFKQRDANGDGKLTIEELTANAEGPQLETMKRFFKAMDKDKDGSVTLDESKAFSKKMTEVMAKAGEKFQSLDLSADGQVSKSEYTAGKKDEDLKKAEKAFDEADTNKDGQLDRREFMGAEFRKLTAEEEKDEAGKEEKKEKDQ